MSFLWVECLKNDMSKGKSLVGSIHNENDLPPYALHMTSPLYKQPNKQKHIVRTKWFVGLAIRKSQVWVQKTIECSGKFHCLGQSKWYWGWMIVSVLLPVFFLGFTEQSVVPRGRICIDTTVSECVRTILSFTCASGSALKKKRKERI